MPTSQLWHKSNACEPDLGLVSSLYTGQACSEQANTSTRSSSCRAWACCTIAALFDDLILAGMGTFYYQGVSRHITGTAPAICRLLAVQHAVSLEEEGSFGDICVRPLPRHKVFQDVAQAKEYEPSIVLVLVKACAELCILQRQWC